MFSPTGLFRNILCPNGDKCRLPNCIFSHQLPAKPTEQDGASSQTLVVSKSEVSEGGDPKRRKLENGLKQASIAVTKEEQKPFMGALTSSQPNSEPKPAPTSTSISNSRNDSPQSLQTALRPVSPPPKGTQGKLKSAKSVQIAKNDVETNETLNPRLIPHDPAGHVTRLLYLKKLHEGMVRLNDEVLKSSDPDVRSLHLSESELIKAALDEEESMARNQPTVYGNVIKLRMVAYKKMDLKAWVELRKEARALKEGITATAAPPPPPPLETGLSPAEELLMLPRLFTNQDGLDKFGYVTVPPSEADIATALSGVEAAAGWEVCDRCKSRFQVFPDRREDGALTTGGTCVHHWGKPFRPKQEKTDAIKGEKDAVYSCCREPLGTLGCTTSPTHVFKISEARRLASVMPFERTPSNPEVGSDRAVCFDCEMGYTCYGLELIRLTATSWPDGKPLVDVLVRPLGQVLDLNSRYSGVFPKHFTEAQDYDMTRQSTEQLQPLRIMPSPAAARSLLFSYISPTTPLMGHALENDLNAVRVVHPNIVDTVLLFAHPKGLPLRFGLKMLVKQHLQKDIQTGGAAGHDSLEDARATGDLIRWKVGKEWKKLKHEGWTVKDGIFYPPATKDVSGNKKKRKIGQMDGVDKTTDEDD